MFTLIETDRQLYQRLTNGDREAYELLFKRFYPKLCAYACQWVSLDDAENVVQDIMLWMWQNHASLSIENSVQTYLFTATKNRCLTLINRGHIRQRVINILHKSIAEQFETPDFYAVNELAVKLEIALEQLPESYREAFIQNRFNNKSYKQIAAEMDISPKTVEYRISQAIKLLRVHLKDYLPLLAFLFYYRPN